MDQEVLASLPDCRSDVEVVRERNHEVRSTVSSRDAPVLVPASEPPDLQPGSNGFDLHPARAVLGAPRPPGIRCGKRHRAIRVVQEDPITVCDLPVKRSALSSWSAPRFALRPTRYVEVRRRSLRDHPGHALDGWPLPAD